MPDATILITAFSRKTFLKEAILSSITSRKQSMRYIEVLLVTNFSVDELDNSLKYDVTYIEVKNAKNKTELVGIGIENAKSEIIIFLDDDDIILPCKIDKVISIFNSNPNLGLLHNEHTRIGENFKVNLLQSDTANVKSESGLVIVNSIEEAVRKNCDVNLSSISIRKCSVIDYLSYFNLFDTSDDTLIMYSVYASSKLIGYIPDKLTLYRIHPGGITALSGDFKSFLDKGTNKLASDVKCHNLFIKLFINSDIRRLQNLRLSYYLTIYWTFKLNKRRSHFLSYFINMYRHLKWIRYSGSLPSHYIKYVFWGLIIISPKAYLCITNLSSQFRLKRAR
jgi:glycosyltransferase involved in cell wall biosynthesis